MKATTCQMSNVCCAMCNVLVKAPNDLLTRRPNPRWENDFVIWSLGQWVLGQVHWTSHNRHSTFDKLWTPFIFSQAQGRCSYPLLTTPDAAHTVTPLS